MACAALLHPSGVDTRRSKRSDAASEDSHYDADQHLQDRPEEFWNEILEASREHWLEYKNCGKVRTAVALWWVARCVDRGPKGSARGSLGSDVGARMASALRHHACVLCDSVLHIPTKSVNIMGEVDDEGEMVDLSGETLSRKDAWRISLLICAEAQARMNATRLGNLSDGLTQRIREISVDDGVDTVRRQLSVLGVEACAFTCLAARMICENRSPKDVEAAENELVRVLGLAVDRQVTVPAQDALRMLSDLQNVPNGILRYGKDFKPAISWLLEQIHSGMHSLHEGELSLLLKTLVGAHVGLKDHPEFTEELREAVDRATYRPRPSYSLSEFLSDDSTESQSDSSSGSEEREERLWQQAHSRNAPGFSPGEAADAALAAKSLDLFEGGSTQLEALLAVSMSSTVQGGSTTGATASTGRKKRPRHRGCIDGTLLATFESFTSRLMPATASWLSEEDFPDRAVNGNSLDIIDDVPHVDITREQLPVYSALGAVEPVQLLDGTIAAGSLSDGEPDTENRSSFDGQAAETVSRVMEDSGCGVLECLQALEEQSWDAKDAVEQLQEERLVAEQATADEC